jgi:hypothetical protein
LNSKVVSVDAYKTALQSSQVYINKIYNAIWQCAMDQYNVTPLAVLLFLPPSEHKKKANNKAKTPTGTSKCKGMDIPITKTCGLDNWHTKHGRWTARVQTLGHSPTTHWMGHNGKVYT